jgi:hypothetical protein
MAKIEIREAEQMSTLRIFIQNNKAFDSRYAALLKKHPDEWVAFHDGAVRATGQSLTEVLERAEQAGLPRKSMCLHYMDTNPAVMIL